MEEDPNGRFLKPVKLENCVICKEAIEVVASVGDSCGLFIAVLAT